MRHYTLRLCTVLVAIGLALGTPRMSGAALFPGDCGKPTKSFPSSGPGVPTGTDALYALKAAVGTKHCSIYICDTNNDLGVHSGDALRILRASVGQQVSLTCPTCPDTGDTNPTSYCACTLQQIKDKLDEDSTGFTNTASDDVAALFGCTTATTRSVANTDWTTTRRTIASSNVWLHSSNITFVANPTCYGASNEDNAADCPDVNSGISFLAFGSSSSNSGLAGFKAKGFFEGVHFGGTNGTIGNMVLDRQCDDSVANDPTGVGSEVRNSTISRGCDKCAQDNAGPTISGSCSGRSCWHIAYYNNTFQGCKQPWRLAGETGGYGAQTGHFLMKGGTVSALANWPCVDGLNLGALSMQVAVSGVSITNCQYGLQLAGGLDTNNVKPTYDLSSNVIDYTDTTSTGNANNRAGVSAFNYADVSLNDNVITHHGKCCGSGTAGRGGVAAQDFAVVDLGTSGMGTGTNKICNNILSNGTTHQEVDNRRTSYTVPASYNWWCNTASGHQPLGVYGLVNSSSALASDPYPSLP